MPVVRLKEDTNIKPKYTQHPSFIWSLLIYWVNITIKMVILIFHLSIAIKNNHRREKNICSAKIRTLHDLKDVLEVEVTCELLDIKRENKHESSYVPFPTTCHKKTPYPTILYNVLLQVFSFNPSFPPT